MKVGDRVKTQKNHPYIPNRVGIIKHVTKEDGILEGYTVYFKYLGKHWWCEPNEIKVAVSILKKIEPVCWQDVDKEEKKKEKVLMEPNPLYGELMTLKEFVAAVRCGGYIDYDGFGYYATKTEMSNIIIRPSDLKGRKKIKKGYGFVVWFNK